MDSPLHMVLDRDRPGPKAQMVGTLLLLQLSSPIVVLPLLANHYHQRVSLMRFSSSTCFAKNLPLNQPAVRHPARSIAPGN